MCFCCRVLYCFFFFKQKTAYEMRMSDWSSDVCSSDLVLVEAIVVEIGDGAAKKLGVQFLLGGKNIPFVATSYSNASPNILTLGGAYAATKLTEEDRKSVV